MKDRPLFEEMCTNLTGYSLVNLQARACGDRRCYRGVNPLHEVLDQRRPIRRGNTLRQLLLAEREEEKQIVAG